MSRKPYVAFKANIHLPAPSREVDDRRRKTIEKTEVFTTRPPFLETSVRKLEF
jgi:hypothetical protein